MAVIGETNITMARVRDILNGAGGSVGDNLTSFFSTGANLNKWSKYKPVIHADFAFFDINTWKSEGYKGKDKRCGLAINTYTPASFKTAISNGESMAWGYNIPYGTSAAPMRLGDFRKYCTTAQNPIGHVATNGLITSSGVSFAIDVAVADSSDTNLTFSDIEINGVKLTNYYLGVYLWSRFASRFYTSSNKIGSGMDLNVTIPLSASLGGEYQFVPFLSSKPQTTGSDDSSSTIISCNIEPTAVTLKIAADMRTATPLGTWNEMNNKVTHLSVYLSNDTSSEVTFTNIKVQLRKSTGTDHASSELVTSVSYSGSVKVSARGYAFVDMPDISHARSSSYNYWIAGYADQTTKVVYWQIEESEKA